MLNTDLAMYKIIQTDENGQSSCGIASSSVGKLGETTLPICEDASSSSTVEAYALDNDAWLNDFADVFIKMLSHQSSGDNYSTLNTV